LKKKTIETEDAKKARVDGGGGAGGGAAVVKRDQVGDSFDDPADEPFWEKFFAERVHYSMYLFSDDKRDCSGIVRRYCGKLVDSFPFQLLVGLAVVLAVSSIFYGDSFQPVSKVLMDGFMLIVFLFEMFLYWIKLGVYGGPKAYFKSPMYAIDFLVNIAMIYGFATGGTVLDDLRVFRLLKIPPLMMYIDRGDTLRLFFKTLFNALPSLTSVVFVLCACIFFFAVIALHIWTGKFGYCSYSEYPGGRGRYESDDVYYPTGCSGTAYTSANDTVGFSLHWKLRLDDFESIFTSCKSILRVITSNEWQGLMFNAMDAIGEDIQPKKNWDRFIGGMAFTYLFLVSMVGITLSALYVSLFYYHYFITTITGGRKPLFGSQDAMWSVYEVSTKVDATDNRVRPSNEI
jgi:hypothetical protein